MNAETWATFALTVATLVLCGVTVWLVVVTRRGAQRQLEVQMWFELAKRFDSLEMKHARKATAKKILSNAKHDEIPEAVEDFFEDVGTLLKFGYIERKLVESSVAFYGTRWWEALRPYVHEERRRHGDDQTIFEDFEIFGKEMRTPEEKIDSAELEQFLADESRLVVD